MKMSASGPFCHGGIRAPQGIPPEGSGDLQKLEAGGEVSSNGSKIQMSSTYTRLIVPEDGGLKVGNTSSSSLIGSSALKRKIFSVFSRLSIISDDRTFVLDEQEASLIPEKKNLREKLMPFAPSPTESHTMTPRKLESPKKGGECGEYDFDTNQNGATNQDGAILTWEGNSSIHDNILQEDEARTPSVCSSTTVVSSVKHSNPTDSKSSKLGWEEENNIDSIDGKALVKICVRGERLRDLRARGMPDYDSWDVKALRVCVP